MKKSYLKFPSWRQRNEAPKMSGRRFKGVTLGASIAYKSDGGTTEEVIEDESKAIAAVAEQVKGFATVLGDKADKAAVDSLIEQVKQLSEGIETMKADDAMALIKQINEGNQKLHQQIAELQEDSAKKKDEEQEGKTGKKKSLISTKDVEEFVKATFGKIPTADENTKGLKTQTPARIEINTAAKAAETFGYATFFEGGADTDITAFTGRVIDPTLYQRRRKRNLILDNFPIRVINVPTLIYLVKVEDGDDEGSASGDSGGAAWIASGEIKPKRSFRVTTGKAEAKEIAIFGTIEDRLLKHVPSLENWVREDFMDEMREGINDGLLNNDPNVDDKAPLGLKINAIQYTATPAYSNAFTANTTNYIDQIFAVAAKMAYDREEAGTIFVTTDVYHRIMHLKDSEGRYQNNNLVYVNNLGQLYIAGVLIVPADHEDLDDTHFIAVAVDMGFKIFAYGPMVFERGLNGEDFRYDRTSYRGYQEFLTYLPTHRENSVMYDTWANVKAAIEA